MYKSIRFQLTVWYVAVLGAILGLFSVGLYTLVANSVSERVDGTLESATQVAALALNHEIEEHGGRESGEESVRLVLNTMHQTSFPRPGGFLCVTVNVWLPRSLEAQVCRLKSLQPGYRRDTRG